MGLDEMSINPLCSSVPKCEHSYCEGWESLVFFSHVSNVKGKTDITHRGYGFQCFLHILLYYYGWESDLWLLGLGLFAPLLR